MKPITLHQIRKRRLRFIRKVYTADEEIELMRDLLTKTNVKKTTPRIADYLTHVDDADQLKKHLKTERSALFVSNAQAILDRYLPEVGQSQQSHMEDTDELKPDGTFKKTRVIDVPKIDAVPEFIDVSTMDEEGNVVVTQELNPIVVADRKARVKAQAAIDKHSV